ALRYYERRVQEEQDKPGLQAAVGLALCRIALIHDRLGDLKKGGDAYTQAAEIYRKLAESDPNNAEYRYGQARSLAEHGDLWDRLGKGEDAEKLARQAYKFFQKAADDFPDDLHIRAGFADCCMVLGTVNYVPRPDLVFPLRPDSSPRRWKESVSLMEQALTLYPMIVENDPQQFEYRWRFHRAQRVLSQMPTLALEH